MLHDGTKYLPRVMDIAGVQGLSFVDADHLVVVAGGSIHWLDVVSDGLLLNHLSSPVPSVYPVHIESGRIFYNSGEIYDLATAQPLYASAVPSLPRLDPTGRYVLSLFGEYSIHGTWTSRLRASAVPSLQDVWTSLPIPNPGTSQSLVLDENSLVFSSSGGGDDGVHLAFASLRGLMTPRADIGVSMVWSNRLTVVGMTNRLSLTITNRGFWHVTNLSIGLPAEFANYFSKVTVSPASAGGVVQPAAINLASLPAHSSASVTLQFSGREIPGDYLPGFQLLHAEPAVDSVAIAATFPLRILPLPEVTLSIPDALESNVNSSTPILFHLSAPSPFPVLCRFSMVSGSALAGVDYVPLQGVLVAIPAGLTETSSPLTILGDKIPESTKVLTARIDSLSGAISRTNQFSGLLYDDDLPLPNVAGASQLEGDSGSQPVRLAVTLNQPAFQPMRVRYSTQGLNATPGVDFVPVTGTLGFAVGQSLARLDVLILGDPRPELDEQFRLVVVAGDPANAPSAAGLVSILDDDPIPTLALGISLAGSGVRVPVPTVEGVVYQLEKADTITGPWKPVGPGVMGTGSMMELEDPAPDGADAFYRCGQTWP